jgi:ketosteroid isomerase-like protein
MKRVGMGLMVGLAALGGVARGAEPTEALAATVRDREIAFAQTIADRDHSAFTSFVSEEALFLGRGVSRGREAVARAWAPFFEGEAPFSWKPERVEVIDSGTLAISSGPVLNAAGDRVGTYNSTWRLEEDGEWRVVLDIGCPPCPCPEDASGMADE